MDDNDYYDDKPSIVIDVGETKCKLGFGGDKTCRFVVPTLIANKEGSTSIGDEAEKIACESTLYCPISRGIIRDWERMEQIMSYCLVNNMRIDPSEHLILVTESSCCPKSYSRNMAQMMFESLGVLGFYPANQGVLSIVASGRNTGISLDCGEGASCVLPMQEGKVFRAAASRQNLAGHDVTMQLKNLVISKGFQCSKLADEIYLRELKQRFCFTAGDYHWAKTNISHGDKSHVQIKLNNGKRLESDESYNMIKLNAERFEAPEVLFQPQLRSDCNEPAIGLPEFVYKSVLKCDVEARQQLLSNVILSGCTTLMPGFIERFSRELTNLAANDYTVRVIAPPERNKSIWMGGSILSSLSHMASLWISKEEYAEYGPDIVHRIAY